jgi:hypothetical protein
MRLLLGGGRGWLSGVKRWPAAAAPGWSLRGGNKRAGWTYYAEGLGGRSPAQPSLAE